MEKRYNNLNILRAVACIAIVMMHVLANAKYFTNNIISNFTNFTFLFMVLSAFSLCCGYYENIKNKELDVERFYKRRVIKNTTIFCISNIIRCST